MIEIVVVEGGMSEPWLLIETSGRGGRVGLAVGGRVTRASDLDPTRRRNRDLAPACGSLLAAEGLRPVDLYGVMVSHGPGSFTGLRVGVMSAKVLAYAAGCRLVAVPTFHAIAEQAPASATTVDVIADALQGHVYVQRYQRAAMSWEPLHALRIVSTVEWVPSLTQDVWVTGPGVDVHGAAIPREIAVAQAEARGPGLDAILRVGLRLPVRTSTEVMQLEPLYLRASSAEEKASTIPNGSG